MNYYSFHIADFALHTSHLTLEEEGVYRRLLDFYYDTETPIPRETKPVLRRLRLVGYEEIAESILQEFFVLKEDGWHNTRADEVIAQYRAKAEIARANGKKGGRPSEKNNLCNGNQEKTRSVSCGNRSKSKSKTNQEPITKNQEPEVSVQATPTHNAFPACSTLKGIDFTAWPSLPTAETMSQWMKVRKNKRATNTQLAMDAVRGEIELAEMYDVTADECIRYAVERSWSGFKWSWIENELAQNGGHLPGGLESVGPIIASKYRKALEHIQRLRGVQTA